MTPDPQRRRSQDDSDGPGHDLPSWPALGSATGDPRDARLRWCPVDATDGTEGMDGITPEAFQMTRVEPSRPLIVRGGVADWPAIERWTDDHLRRQLGHSRTWVETSADQFEGRVFDDVAEIELTFSEFLDRMTHPEGRHDYHVGHWLRPELAVDVREHTLFEGMGPLHRRRMIMSRGGNRIAMHFDWYENFIAQIAGYKRLVLVDPLDTPQVRPLVSHTNYSALDVRAIDHDAWPALGEATLHIAELRPGDLLYLPAMWWHTVESAGRNIMVSSAFVERDAACLRVIEGLLAANELELSASHAAAVRALLDGPTPSFLALARYARRHGLTALSRFTRHRIRA